MLNALLLGHVTAYEVPQFSLYMIFAFLLGVSIAAVLRTGERIQDRDEDQ
ncbi:MAG: hypothetical protein ABEK50_03025 [bacterium]